MAVDREKKPTAADKGKGKATNGEAEKNEAGKGKDGKPEQEDKKGALPAGMQSRAERCHSSAEKSSY